MLGVFHFPSANKWLNLNQLLLSLPLDIWHFTFYFVLSLPMFLKYLGDSISLDFVWKCNVSVAKSSYVVMETQMFHNLTIKHSSIYGHSIQFFMFPKKQKLGSTCPLEYPSSCIDCWSVLTRKEQNPRAKEARLPLPKLWECPFMVDFEDDLHQSKKPWFRIMGHVKLSPWFLTGRPYWYSC